MLTAEGRLRPYRAIDVCRQVAGALDAAHAKGLIHRDVKPANVLIAGRNAFLTDFGLTKRVAGDDPITHAGDVVGTIHYVAPEQIEGARGDGAHRRLLARLRALPLPDRRTALRARHRRRRDLRAPVRGAAEALARAPRPARGPGRRDREGARQVAGPALRDVRRPDGRRARRSWTPPARSPRRRRRARRAASRPTCGRRSRRCATRPPRPGAPVSCWRASTRARARSRAWRWASGWSCTRPRTPSTPRATGSPTW